MASWEYTLFVFVIQPGGILRLTTSCPCLAQFAYSPTHIHTHDAARNGRDRRKNNVADETMCRRISVFFKMLLPLELYWNIIIKCLVLSHPVNQRYSVNYREKKKETRKYWFILYSFERMKPEIFSFLEMTKNNYQNSWWLMFGWLTSRCSSNFVPVSLDRRNNCSFLNVHMGIWVLFQDWLEKL